MELCKWNNNFNRNNNCVKSLASNYNVEAIDRIMRSVLVCIDVPHKSFIIYR